MVEQNKSIQKKEGEPYFRYLIYILCFALFSILIVLTPYFINFDGSLSSDNNIWGTFGDYIGGTLNPLLSFSALIALLYTIYIQSKELKLSRKELELTRIELIKTGNAAQQQAEHFIREEKRNDIYKSIDKLSNRITKNYNSNRLPEDLSLHRIISDHENRDDYIGKLKEWFDNDNIETLNLMAWVMDDLSRLMTYLEMYAEASTPAITACDNPEDLTKSIKNDLDGITHGGLVKDYFIEEFRVLVRILYENDFIDEPVYEFYCKT